MQSPLVSTALDELKPPEGYELLKARIEREPDGTEYVRLLLDYGIGGVKVYRVAVSPELLAVAYAQPAEAEEESTPPAPPSGGEKSKEVKPAARRRK